MKNYNLFLAISLILGSCGSSRYSSLKYVKCENVHYKNQSIAENKNEKSIATIENQIAAIAEKYNDLVLPIINSVNELEGEISCDKTDTTKVEKDDSLRVRKFVNIHIDKNGKRMDDFQDDESLDNSNAKKLVSISKGSFIPVIGWVFAIVTIFKAKLEWSRIVNNPDTYSGKRKVLLARRLAVTATLIGLAITLVFVAGFLVAITA
jgi:hypothetical protein